MTQSSQVKNSDASPMSDARTLIAALQSEINLVLSPYLVGVTDYALLDFPDHTNVGDSAIWRGEVAYLTKKLGRSPRYVCTYDDWSKEDFIKAVPSGPIFLHGGGNFGDVWPQYQNFRLKIISDFPDRLIIQLPQTLYFSSAANLRNTAETIAEHKNFILLTRDLRSFELATREFSCAVYRCPDMAFCLGPQRQQTEKTRELLLLLRTDVEKVDHKLDTPLPEFVAVEDWLWEPRGIGKSLFAKAWLQKLISSLRRGRLPSRLEVRFGWYQLLSGHRVERGLKQLGSSSYVITDRLHSHILSVLLDLPHTVLDNNYGKIGAYVEAWTKSFDGLSESSGELDQEIKLYCAMREQGRKAL